ncbi:MAG: sigma factor-like helix-turn-helix DNA-binding protein, partial [bacterium]
SPMEETKLKDQRENIENLLAQLPEQERQVLILRFGLDESSPKTLVAIGEEFSLTRERIRQIEGSALKRLRKIMQKNKLTLSEFI